MQTLVGQQHEHRRTPRVTNELSRASLTALRLSAVKRAHWERVPRCEARESGVRRERPCCDSSNRVDWGRWTEVSYFSESAEAKNGRLPVAAGVLNIENARLVDCWSDWVASSRASKSRDLSPSSNPVGIAPMR